MQILLKKPLIERVTGELPKNMDKLIHNFILGSGDYERTVDSVLRQIHYLLANNGAMWIIGDSDSLFGYFLAEIVPTEYESSICLVHQLFIKRNRSSRNLIKQVDAIITGWAKNKNVKDIAFYSRRSPEAFMRLLGRDWLIDSYVLKRCA